MIYDSEGNTLTTREQQVAYFAADGPARYSFEDFCDEQISAGRWLDGDTNWYELPQIWALAFTDALVPAHSLNLETGQDRDTVDLTADTSEGTYVTIVLDRTKARALVHHLSNWLEQSQDWESGK